jgi:diguanylate cyclase (GGDEF)-like protein
VKPAVHSSLSKPSATAVSSLERWMHRLEDGAPFAAGSVLLGSGLWGAAHAFGAPLPPAPIGAVPATYSLLMAGAGTGIVLSAYERIMVRRRLKRAEESVSRANAQRDLALMQSRRLKTQAEGLALMREIHRSTSIPQRGERLHRILTLLADLFEAREVTLLAVSGADERLSPAACLRSTNKEEFFLDFNSDEAHGSETPLYPLPKLKKNSASILREGCNLLVEGVIEFSAVLNAKARWRPGAQADTDAFSRNDPGEILEAALARVDVGAAAEAQALEALKQKRTQRGDENADPSRSGARDGLVLNVPLIADQKAVGVLRIRRSVDGYSGTESEALEELLIESAKHIALALKKDEDDRKAITDVLTSLFIKRHFLQLLEQLRAQAVSTGTPFCLVLCDIDHFKKVNDNHGHLSGDIILKGVAGVLKRSLRAGDMAFRYGGEEMALLLPGASVEAAEQTAERIREAVQTTKFYGEKGQHVPITLSLGVTHHLPGLTGEALISRADRALYASKQNGRNKVTRWSSELPDPLAKK